MGVKTGRFVAAVAALACAWGAAGEPESGERVRPECGTQLDDSALSEHVERASAVARLVGYVRFFHANDGVFKSDWDALTARLMEEALESADATDLAKRLNGLIGKVAPLVRVYVEGEEVPERVEAAPSDGAQASLVAAWEHVGLRIGVERAGMWYRSDRKAVSLQDPKAFERVPDPRSEIDESLGAGIRVAMPVSVLIDTKIRSMPAGEPYRGDEGAWGYDKEAMRLAAAATGWAAMRHFSVVGNERETDWDAALQSAMRRATVESVEHCGLRRGFEELGARAGDGQARAQREGTRHWRVGVSLVWAGDRVFVERVEGAEGLRVGDEVIEVRGETIADAVRGATPRAAGVFEEARRARALEAVCQALGESDRVSWVVARDGARVEVDTGVVAEAPAAYSVRVLDNGVRVVRVGEAYGDELIKEMELLAGARGVVIDARNMDTGTARALGWIMNGVYLAAPEWSATLLLPEWNGVKWRDETGEVGPKGTRMGGAVALLTDARTVGAAEVAAIVMKDLRQGILVGERTGGCAGRVIDARMPGGMWLRFTGTRAHRYDGSAVNGVGVEPDVVVERTAEGMAAGRDEALERAVEIVLEKAGGVKRE